MTWNAVPYNAVVQVPGEQTRRAYFTGAGAAAPTVAASTVAAGQHNLAATKGGVAQVGIVRNGAGDYTFTFIKDASPGLLLDVKPNVRGPNKVVANVAAASLDGSNRLVVQVLTWDIDAAAAIDLASTDTLVLDIIGTNTRAS